MNPQLAERVVQIPRLYESGNKSTAALLKDAGLPDTAAPPSAQEIEQVLAREPALADLWLKRGSDQRLTGGWGIERDEQGAYRIQNFASGKGLTERNRVRACAEFAARYVAFIGDVLRRWH